jgi:hypothetical protein
MAARKRSEMAAPPRDLDLADEPLIVTNTGEEAASVTRETPMAQRFGRIVECILEVEDVEATYAEIEDWLRPVDAFKDHGVLARQLERGEILARKAHAMWMAAKLAKDAHESDNAGAFGAMRKFAVETLEKEKDLLKAEKKTAKQINETDIELEVARQFVTDYRQHQIGRRKAKILDESLAHLVDTCASKIRSLQALLGKQR